MNSTASRSPLSQGRPIVLLNLSTIMHTLYRGYQCNRNQLDKRFYAYPTNDLTTCRRIVCDTAIELREAIDKATSNQTLNPWELPRASA